MPWHSDFPLGSVSVKSNKSIGQDNTTYVETTMGNDIVGTNTADTRDHFWDVSGDLDGHHRFIKSPAFTVGGNPADPEIGTGMSGVKYLKTILGTVQEFYRNVNGIYQSTPAFLTGQVTISGNGGGDWKTLPALPQLCYGEIFFFQQGDKGNCQNGIFSTTASYVRAYSERIKIGASSGQYRLELRNDDSSTLAIQVRRGDAFGTDDGVWNYRITYRAQ